MTARRRLHIDDSRAALSEDPMRGPYRHRGPQAEKDAAALVPALYNADRNTIDAMRSPQMRSLLHQAKTRVVPTAPSVLPHVDPHVQTFRRSVDRWLAGTVRDADRARILVYVAQDPHRPRFLTHSWMAYLRRKRRAPRIRQSMDTPPERVTRAFRALHHRIELQDYGAAEFPPLRCVQCKRLVVPLRSSWQTTCSAQCNQAQGYVRFLAREKALLQAPTRQGTADREPPTPRKPRDVRRKDRPSCGTPRPPLHTLHALAPGPDHSPRRLRSLPRSSPLRSGHARRGTERLTLSRAGSPAVPPVPAASRP